MLTALIAPGVAWQDGGAGALCDHRKIGHGAGGVPEEIDEFPLVAGHVLVQNKGDDTVFFEASHDVAHGATSRNSGHAIFVAQHDAKRLTRLALHLFADGTNVVASGGEANAWHFPTAEVAAE